MYEKNETGIQSGLEPQQQELLTTEGFIKKFLLNTCRCHTNEKAYEITEREYIFLFGRSKYKNFETFKATMYRHVKKTRKKRCICQ